MRSRPERIRDAAERVCTDGRTGHGRVLEPRGS